MERVKQGIPCDCGIEDVGKRSAIFAVEEVAHGSPARFIGFGSGFAFIGVDGLGDYRVGGFGFAAGWAAIGEAGFIRLQLELFAADSTDSDRESHPI